MAEKRDKLIGYCGYNCHLCAARSEDFAVRQKLVDAWRKYFCIIFCWKQEGSRGG
jgi:hypothetical protein